MKKLVLLFIVLLLFSLSLFSTAKDQKLLDLQVNGLAPHREYFNTYKTMNTNPYRDPDFDGYAYNAYDPTGTYAEGPIYFAGQDPTTITLLAPTTSGDFIAGGCWIADEETWYGCQYGGGLYTIDHTNGTMTYIAYTSGLNGIEYDDASGIMYGTDGTSLYTVDWTTGATTLVGSHNIGFTMIGIASDDEGNMYGVTVDFSAISDLYSIDLATGNATSIGSTGGQLLYAQDIAFDKDNGVLYSSAYFGDGTPPGLYEIDTGTGAMTGWGNFPGGMEVTGFAIPYTLAEPGAPAAPSDLVVTPDPGGALSCDISWTCPDLTFAGDPLTELLEMRVYRDDVLVYTDSAPVIGGLGSYTDYPSTSGLYDYSVVGYNTEGEGPAASEDVWVGEDVPNFVENLDLVEQNGMGYLTWDNPTTGLNGGAFNNPILGYHIERLPDNVTFEIAGIATDFLDTTIPGAAFYSYEVTAYNSIGDGGTATSNIAMIGAGEEIFFDDFEAGIGNWNVIINSGQGMWTIYAPPYPNNYQMPPTSSGNVCSADSDETGSGTTTDTTLELLNALNLSTYNTVNLQFDNDFNAIADDDYCYIDVSNDGGTTWNNVLTWSGTDVTATHEIIDITAYAAFEPNVIVRFVSVQPGWDWWWTIDNVGVYGTTVIDPQAPGPPTDVTFIPDAGGALETAIAWTCPTVNVIGDPLTELLEMRVYRDAVLVYTDTNPIMGGLGNCTDYPPAAGFYDYAVVGYNSEGDGIPFCGNPWVGEDVPDAVTDLTLTDVSTDDLAAQLDWVNPTTGLHGGYFAGCTGYDIERSDGAAFTIPGPVTQWIDDTIVDPGIYWYALTPFNNSGPGPTSYTPMVGIGITVVEVGNAEITDYHIPMNIFYENSITECVYDKEWIGTDMLINTVSYHAAGITSNINPFNLEVWIGEIDVDDLTGGWIDGSQLTQVYAGTIDVPTGDYWLDIPLDTTFEYTYTHNLVIMIIKDDDEYFSTSDVWWTTESGTPSRTLHKCSDSVEYDAMNPPASPNDESTYPDIRFYFSVLAHGDVEGVVTDAVTTNPMEGVDVYVGTWGPATTNALGEYLLEDLVTGMQDVGAFKDGYYNYQGQVEVLPDVIVQHDFVMQPYVFGALDGTVTDAESGDPLVGAQINAISDEGYEYDAVTNDAGYYFIDNVIAETYDVTCSFPNYPTGVVEDVLVEEGLTTTVDFALEGYAYWCDFEANDGGLISDNPGGWQWGAFTSGPMAGYSGTNGWATVIGGNYPNGSNFTLDTPMPFFVVSPLAELKFWHWYDIEASYDGGNVKVSTDGGISWSVITPLTGYTGTANTSNPLSGEEIFCGHDQGFWEEAVFDISGYIGQSIIIRWHFGSDSSVQYPGWYIDDVSVSGADIPDPGWLEGTVTEFGTANPIEGAVVSIVGTGLSATTLADGTYSIIDIWPEDYDISCEAAYYLPTEELGYTIVTGLNTLDFVLLWSEIAVDVTELVSNLPPDETEVQTFIITNDGPGELEYNISFDFLAEVRVRNISRNNSTPSRANVNTSKQNTLRKTNISSEDRDPNASSHTHGTPSTDDLFDLQFSYPVGVGGGEAGMECDGNYLYTTKWNGGVFYRYAMDGTFIEEFSVTGCPGSIRDLAYDGQYFYGAAASTTVYEMDFDAQTVISTINAPIAVRAIAYDEINDGFWGNNWSDQITLFDRNGATLDSFPCGGFQSYYGFAWEDVLPGGPYLWGYSQVDGLTGNTIVQIEIATGLETGVNCDLNALIPNTSVAGGLYITDAIVPGKWTIGGTMQNEIIWGVELADAVNWVMATNNASGTVPGNGGSIVVEVTFDATELTIGEILTADLLIHNNSNYGDDYIIPVTLNVISVGTEEDPPVLYTKLSGNYPNPFNPETAIKFALNEAGKVRIDIFNIKGQYVKTLVNEHLEAAYHSVIWDGKDDSGASVSSGVYFYKMDAAKYTSTKKMILMK